MATFIALLRGINVGGRNRIPMLDLRLACAELGWADVRTYIQSGNLLLEGQCTAVRVEEELERVIKRRFDLAIPVIARAAADWSAYIRGNPFPEASRTEPNLLMLALSKTKPKRGAAAALQERAVNGEHIVGVSDALWIHFARGVAKSKLSPGLLDRIVGSPVTTRNWRTVLKLEELAQLTA